MGWILFLLFFTSRILFANPANVFFDSKEYLTRFMDPSLWSALTSGHTPLHDGYIMTFWPVFKIASLFTSFPESVMIIFQILMSFGTVWFFYKITEILFSKETAFKAAIVLSFMPLFWISNGTIMMESTYLFYWIGFLYFLLVYLKVKGGVKYLIISSVFWCLAFLTHTVVVLWIPFVLAFVWIINRKKFTKVFLIGLLALIIVSFVNVMFLMQARGVSLWQGFFELFVTKIEESAPFSFNITTIARYFRNWIVPTFYNNNGLMIVFSVVGFFKLIKTNKKFAVLFFLWIAPSFITNQWWDSLFFGRHALISIFALAILASTISKKILYFVLVLYMSICSLVAINSLINNTPYLEMQKSVRLLPTDGLLIDTHFSRPQINGEYKGEIFFVGEPGFDENSLPLKIDKNIKRELPVFVTGQALTEPYGLFNGPYIHSLTLSYKQPYLLKDILNIYSFEEVNIIDKSNNLVIYKVISKPGLYPETNILISSNKRLDKLDFISKTIIGLFFWKDVR